MPSGSVHQAISKERTGFDFAKLHEWIDKPYKKFGADHRLFRHAYCEDDERTIRDYWNHEKGSGWGDKAVVEWLFHIAIDNLETAFKKARNAYSGMAYNFFEFGLLPDSKYIFFDFDRLNEAELCEEFKDAYDYGEE